jgi:hypothetical protein
MPTAMPASLLSVDASRALTRSHNCGLVFSAATHAGCHHRVFLAPHVTAVHVNREIPQLLIVVSKLFSENRSRITAALNHALLKNLINILHILIS